MAKILLSGLKESRIIFLNKDYFFLKKKEEKSEVDQMTVYQDEVSNGFRSKKKDVKIYKRQNALSAK